MNQQLGSWSAFCAVGIQSFGGMVIAVGNTIDELHGQWLMGNRQG
jgi:hypothetical protein